MRYLICLIFVMLAHGILGQVRDTRAVLDTRGNVYYISVAPDEKIWLTTTTGYTYNTQNIDSIWHVGLALPNSYEGNIASLSGLGRLTFFNKDTALLTGYISFKYNDSNRDGYYFTKNGGISWELLKFEENISGSDVFADKSGKAWLNGKSGGLFFSDNFGQSWRSLKFDLSAGNRVYSISMKNANQGVLGTNYNGIFITENNWETSKNMPTPFDFKLYDLKVNSLDHPIKKIRLWGKYIVVNQQGNVFYSLLNKIHWKKFKDSIVDFEIDRVSDNLYGITNERTVIQILSPVRIDRFASVPYKDQAIDMTVVNNSVYLLYYPDKVCKINKQKTIFINPYTTDYKIETPNKLKILGKFKLGIEKENLYLSDNGGNDWYREKILDFEAEDIRLLNDSNAIIWDGNENHLYSLQNHSIVNYNPVKPFKYFLPYSLKTVVISAGSRGCFHHRENSVTYERGTDSVLTTFKWNREGNTKFTDTVFYHFLGKDSFMEILATINSNTEKILNFRSFKISKEDFNTYYKLVDEQLELPAYDNTRNLKKEKEFYYKVPQLLDTLNLAIIDKIYAFKDGGGYSTTHEWFALHIVNQNNDTIFLNNWRSTSFLPWFLPWDVEYKGQHFKCYNLTLSKFIRDCIPDGFTYKENFDNAYLIKEIADYLYQKR